MTHNRDAAHEAERVIATVVEALLAQERGQSVGPRKRRDAVDGSGLRVDFTYDEASPPVAMEITTIEDGAFRSAGDASQDLCLRLQAAADREGLSPFQFVIQAAARIRDLYEPLLHVMRDGLPIRVGDYSSNDLIEWTQSGTENEHLELHARLTKLGILEAEPIARSLGVQIATWNDVSFKPLTGLDAVIASNYSKLLEAGDRYERHLVVYVAAFGTSANLNGSEVPGLPVGLDRLWVLHDPRDGSQSLVPWSVSPHHRGWIIHERTPAEIKELPSEPED